MSTQIIIPGGPFSFQAKTGLSLSGGVHAQEVEDDFLEQREILWCVVLTDGTGIFPHGDIEHPGMLSESAGILRPASRQRLKSP